MKKKCFMVPLQLPDSREKDVVKVRFDQMPDTGVKCMKKLTDTNHKSNIIKNTFPKSPCRATTFASTLAFCSRQNRLVASCTFVCNSYPQHRANQSIPNTNGAAPCFGGHPRFSFSHIQNSFLTDGTLSWDTIYSMFEVSTRTLETHTPQALHERHSSTSRLCRRVATTPTNSHFVGTLRLPSTRTRQLDSASSQNVHNLELLTSTKPQVW